MKALPLISLLLLGVCRPSPKPAQQPASLVAPTDTVLVLERTACFGFCPTYRLAITAEGRAHLEGTGRAMGFARELSLSPSAVAALLRRFKSAGFFGLNSAYVPDRPLCQVYATDQPGAYLFANDGINRHAVTHYFGCRGPRGTATDTLLAVPYRLLFALEGSIDSVAGTATYIDSLSGSRGG